MKNNLLAENMRRFGTKNLNEDAYEPRTDLRFAKKKQYNDVWNDISSAAEDLADALHEPKMEYLPVVQHAIAQITKWTSAKKPAPLAVYILAAEAPALLDKMQTGSKKAWLEMRSHWGGIVDDIVDEDED